MLTYILKRLFLMVPTLVGVLFVTFAITQFVPGGPVEQYLSAASGRTSGKGGGDGGAAVIKYRGSEGVDEKQLAQIKALYGFDKPPAQRFWDMLVAYAKFDLGQSFFQHKAVWDLILEKLPVSVSLGLWTLLISYGVAIPLGMAIGVLTGTTQSRGVDQAWTTTTLVLYAVPTFWLGQLMVLLFALKLDWFPTQGMGPLVSQAKGLRTDEPTATPGRR